MANPSGQMAYWNGTGNAFTYPAIYGPYSGWTPASLNVGPDANVTRLATVG
jgi:hypothetical protein